MSHRLKTVLNLSSFPVKQSQPRGVGGGRGEGGTFRTFKCPSLKRLKTDSKHVESEQEKPRRWRAWSLPHRLSYCGNKRTSIFFFVCFFFSPLLETALVFPQTERRQTVKVVSQHTPTVDWYQTKEPQCYTISEGFRNRVEKTAEEEVRGHGNTTETMNLFP